MCLAIPSRIERIAGDVALVRSFGQTREVSLALLAEPVQVGDYVLVQLGRYAFERLEADEAEATLQLMASLADDVGSDVRRW